MTLAHDTDPMLAAAIVQGMAEALIFADCEGITRTWNPGAEALFGFTAAEAIGQSLDLIIPEAMRAAHWRGYRRAIEEGRTHHGRRSMVTRALTKTGETIYVDMSFALVHNADGSVAGSVAVASDANERYLKERDMKKRLAELEGNAPV